MEKSGGAKHPSAASLKFGAMLIKSESICQFLIPGSPLCRYTGNKVFFLCFNLLLALYILDDEAEKIKVMQVPGSGETSVEIKACEKLQG